VLASAVISRDGLPIVLVSPNDRTVLLQFLQVRRHNQ
jgi:antitoxin component of RelBE/YafQ-DinJ toxin-antitoxin module